MTKDQKILAGLGVVAALILLYLFAKHGSAQIVDASGNPIAQHLPQVAPITPNPSIFNFPGGGFVPTAMGNGCGCSLPGVNNATSNLLPASASAFTDLVARSGVDPTALNYQIIAASQQTDFFPQTSSLALMAVSGGPSATPF